MRFIKFDCPHFFLYLFTPAVNTLLLSSQSTKNFSTSSFHSTQTSCTINQQSLHSRTINLCSGDVTISNLITRLAYLNISFISLFIYLSSMVKGLLVLSYSPSLYVTLSVLHTPPAFRQLSKQTIISFCRLLRGTPT